MTSEEIARENDLFRSTMIESSHHKIILTAEVLESKYREEIITAVRSYRKFNADNDQYGEHDFGQVTVGQDQFYFKIDYYDKEFEFGVDPYEGPVSRMMTIMSVYEY